MLPYIICTFMDYVTFFYKKGRSFFFFFLVIYYILISWSEPRRETEYGKQAKYGSAVWSTNRRHSGSVQIQHYPCSISISCWQMGYLVSCECEIDASTFRQFSRSSFCFSGSCFTRYDRDSFRCSLKPAAWERGPPSVEVLPPRSRALALKAALIGSSLSIKPCVRYPFQREV